MVKYWIQKAHQYIKDHNCFDNVSDIHFSEENQNFSISATISVNLPSKFISEGITGIGVRSKEDVEFVFTDQFPLKAPKILLRHDFPRCFPHINPSISDVNPCIYEGELTELLQQSEWMYGILNQLVDWLEKAACNDLLDYSQGWEPMRNDYCSGYMQYDLDEVISAFKEENSIFLTKSIHYEERKKIIVTGVLCDTKNKKKAQALYCLCPNIIETYVPNTILTIEELYNFGTEIGIVGLKKQVELLDLKNLLEDKLFIILALKRPVNLIGSERDIEFLNFIVHKGKSRKNKKRTLPDCKIGMLNHIHDRSQRLLKRLSGTRTKIDESKSIALVGCGSLGSKIGMHLTRNGTGPFLCVDDDIFMPHNNARHALSLTWAQNKAELLTLSMFSTSGIASEAIRTSAYKVDYSKSRIIIDTTASLSVQNYFLAKTDLPPVIACRLYAGGRFGLVLLENKIKTSRLIDIWAHLYSESLEKKTIRKILFSSTNTNSILIGQSCSSQTMVGDDALISLISSSMSLKIQNCLENGLPENGEISFLSYNENYSLNTNTLSVPKSTAIESTSSKEWKVLITEPVSKKLKAAMLRKSPNETGGVLLGTVFMFAKTMIVTNILDAPPDSIESPSLFVLGTEGLEKQIKQIEKKTNAKVTYLGTWHSHPCGGAASGTDKETFKKLIFIRNYEPTVCLIVTPHTIFQV